MAKLDYRRCKQGKTEAIQTFHARKVRLFMDAFRVEPANMAARMEQFTDDYIESIVRREVKLELLQNKPYATPEAVLTRAMSSCATHRALVPEGAPASAFDGLHSTNHYGATTTAAVKAGAAAEQTVHHAGRGADQGHVELCHPQSTCSRRCPSQRLRWSPQHQPLRGHNNSRGKGRWCCCRSSRTHGDQHVRCGGGG